MPILWYWSILCSISGSQIYYLSSMNADGTDDYCEQLGWKRLQEYDPAQRSWKYLSTFAEGNANQGDNLPLEDDLEEEDYCPSLPFAVLFACFKVLIFQVWLVNYNLACKLNLWPEKKRRDMDVMLYGLFIYTVYFQSDGCSIAYSC